MIYQEPQSNLIDKGQTRDMMASNGLKADDLSKKLGKSPSHISNLIRILELDEEIHQMIISGKISMGHARALLSLSLDKQLESATKIVKQGLSVRATENLVKQLLDGNQHSRPKNDVKDSNITKLENDLSERLATKVLITHQSSGRGKLQISYNSLAELEGILKRLD